MNRPFHQFLLTRFSVRIRGERFQERAWLEKRFELFERFCFPSVAGQSTQCFDWFVFFDSSLPEDLQARVESWARFPAFHAVFVTGRFDGGLVCRVLREFGVSGEYVITSRVDNDDALATRFMETVQSSFHRQAFEFVNQPCGYFWDGSRAWAVRNHSNAFISLVERADGFRTVLSFNHARALDAGPIRQAGSMPGWLAVLHGDNLANSPRGEPVSGDDWKKHFAVSDWSVAALNSGLTAKP